MSSSSVSPSSSSLMLLLALVVGASAACKQISFSGIELPDNACFSTLTTSVGVTCNGTSQMSTITVYTGSTCTGVSQGSYSQALVSTDVCGVNDTDCRTGMSIYTAAACTASQLSASVDLVPDTCFSGYAKFFCGANGTETAIAMYGSSPCSGNPLSLLTMKNQRCVRFGRSAVTLKSCMNGPAPPAGPATTSTDAYVDSLFTSTSACAPADRVGNQVSAAGGVCVSGNKYYCEGTGAAMESVSVSYENGTLCTGAVVGVARRPVGVCSQIGTALYQKTTCSAGSSPVKSTEKVSASSELSVEYYADSTCSGSAAGTATVAVGVCVGGNQLVSCSSGTSATVMTFDSSSGPCNMSQTVPPITNEVLSASCSNYEGEYVKVIKCGTAEAAYIKVSVFVKALVVAAVFLQFM